MPYEVIVQPTEEPVSLQEMKDHLRVDITDDDDLIQAYSVAARRYLEETMRRAFITQTIAQYHRCFPYRDFLRLVNPPIQSVVSIQYTDSDGDTHTVDSNTYTVDTVSTPGRVVLNYNEQWPTVTLATNNPVRVEFIAGAVDAAGVPQTFKQAIMMLTAHYYENRETIVATGAVPKEMPFSVVSLLQLDRNYL